ncbi:MFS transporter [Rhodoplanes sp. TEM]|uniref:MFS transporter n=1 Tax=Rhodoplanes tepidamans TaxID=200616 RepID=A0ABT5JD81_RHOTP|nr:MULTISPECIES: MFS transporter [Rhodoplanes]MDC7787571.1 MFS transporter [Rhodoplanes tepidamans]MDC7984936.1 MFS transporter [Rhodoplanes sp. TEM]MDQ0358000.1 EmrB/QacA subfamily drug resistance transporter [Rhodoplanes tepidamans]
MAGPPLDAPALDEAAVRRIVFGVLVAMFLAAVNQTVVTTALPTIGRALGNFADLTWVVTAYLLATTVAAPLYGKLADAWGRRVMLMAAVALFMAGSTVAALAPDMATLIAGRGLQGIGGGGIFPLAQTVISDVVAPRDRGRYQAYIGVVWLVAGLGGPVIGGVLAQHGHWSMIFWANLPLGAVVALSSWRALARLPQLHRPHRIDWLGAALMTVAAIAALLALGWGGTRVPWLSGIIAGLAAVAVLFAALFAWRLATAAEPFLSPAILKNPVVRLGTLASASAVSTPMSMTVFLPLYYETVHGLTAAMAGVALVPVALASAPGSMLSSRAMTGRRGYKRMPAIGLAAAVAAAVALALLPGAPLGLAMALLCVVAFGTGTAIPVCTVCIQNAVAPHRVGTATGMMNFSRALLSALLVAVLGAILLAGFGVVPERGARAAGVLLHGADAAAVYRWLFAASAVAIAGGFVAFLRMEERPLAGPGPRGEP